MPAKTAKPPADFSKTLTKALWRIRVGDYGTANALLEPLEKYLPAGPVALSPTPDEGEYYRLRLATLTAEVADYKGDYNDAAAALRPYDHIVRELQEMTPEDVRRANEPRQQLLLRQKLYYLWQKSVLYYRNDAIARSGELLHLAIRLAEHLQPRSQALLAQLYYGAGKLAFHECREVEATAMYRESLVNASDHFDKVRDGKFKNVEIEAARYSVAKTLALGLGQCLREQGRLEEARTQVVAGLFLLNLSKDAGLSHYARLLLGSIERSMAGEKKSELLGRASDRVDKCEAHFTKHTGEVGNRWRLERALVEMQKGQLAGARKMLEEMLRSAPEAKWIAEICLALSRVARRAEAHAEAIEFARKSVKAAEGLERTRRRSQVVLVLALYGAATDGGEVRDDLLKETLREIDRAMASVSEPDVRTHANMLLTKARVLNAKREIASALEIYKQYEAIKPLVEVGRIHELAEEVKKELEPAMTHFRCPADLVPPVFDLDENFEALRRYVMDKVSRAYDTKTEQAVALNRNRTTLYTGSRKPKARA